jgi:hypothetical protein
LSSDGFSQTQHGYVKTLGRPDKKGEALSEVSIRIKEEHNPVLSNEDGAFSLLLTGKKNGDAYTLQEVQKKGYELNETGVIGRQYAYSDRVPLTIVMVSSIQLHADKQRIENNAYNVAEKTYKAKVDLLERQKEENSISEEQYRKELLDLQDKFEKYQLLIDGLAEHYAHVDYDELNEKEREVNISIENGELEKADSLIKTMFDPIDVLKRNKEALAQLNQQISEANTFIDKANEDMAAVLKQQEKDANYLYQLYTIALSRFDNDKAGQYIGTRAELDTTNILWQTQAGEFYLDYMGDYSTSINYFSRALDISVSHYGKFHQQVALCYAYIGRAIEMSGNYEQAERAYNEALVIQKRVLPEFHWDIARSYRLLSEIYLRQREFIEAANYNQHSSIILMGLLNYSSLVKGSQDPAGNVLKDSIDFEKVKKELSNSYITAGKIHEKNNMLEEAKRYYDEALKIRLKNKYCHMADSIECYLNIGSVLYHTGDIIRARTILQNGLQTSKKLWGENHIFTLSFYDYLGLVYSRQNDIEDASKYHRIALDAKRKLYGNMNIEFVKSLCYYSFSYNNVGDSIKAAAYRELALGVTNNWLETGRKCSNGNFESLQASLNYYYDALDIRQLLLGNSHPEIAMVYNLMGVSYRKQSRTYMAISVYKKALEIVQATYKEPHPSVAAIRNNLAQVYYEISDYHKALENLLESLRIKELLYEANSQTILSAIEMTDIVFEKCIEYYPTDKFYKKQYELFKKKYNLVK